MKVLSMTLLMFGLNLCPVFAQEKAQVNFPFMEKYCVCNYGQVDGFPDKGKSSSRVTLDQTIPVYAYPDKGAKETGAILPFTHVELMEEGMDTVTNTKWLKVKSEVNANGIYKEQSGYIIDDLISIGAVSGNAGTGSLNYILSKSPLRDKDLKQPLFRLNAVKYAGDNSEPLALSSYDLNIGPVDYFNHFYLTSVYNCALGKMPNLLRLYWHHGESCPESEGNVFIFGNENKMNEIISASATGEGGFYEFTKVYIPLKFDKGKILLVENGDSEHMLDAWNATLKTIPYPEESGIPIERLIVTIEESGAGKSDADGNFIVDKDDNIVMEITHRIIRYYQWDGERLTEAKKIVIKEAKEE
jgi:hypothetical protein